MRRFLALLLAACSPYDPDLGNAPFLCGTQEPRCPDGYVAVQLTPIRCECQRPTTADGGPGYFCFNDPNEPNESFQNPTPVVIVPPLPRVFENIAVCPANDNDVYAVAIAQVGSELAVEVLFDTAREAPALDILDMSGGSLGPTVLAPEAGKLTASIRTSYSGTHHVALSAGALGEEVNYTLRIQVTEP